MYLIYFYSHISDEIIPKDVINDFSNIENNIIKIIKDIIIFEEGKKKADLLSIFKNDEKILFDGLDDGIYIQQKGNKYYFKQNRWKLQIMIEELFVKNSMVRWNENLCNFRSGITKVESGLIF